MNLYAWGANSHGQLGIGKISECELPTKVDNIPENILKIVGGGGHTIILDSAGDLLVAGWNSKGQLGTGTKADSTHFIKLKTDLKFCYVTCGWDTSAGITTDNRLFLWGSNRYDQLGFSNKEYKTIYNPIELKLPKNLEPLEIHFGLRHSVVMTKTRQILVFGSLKHFKHVKCEIYVQNSTEFLLLPISGVHHIASGQNHITYVDDQNSINIIGDDKWFKNCNVLQQGEKILQISAGWTHNAFLTESRELFLYGRNNYGQLGIGHRSDCETVQKCDINPIDDFQLGAEHGILKSKNEIFTWGWNEHGNCGNGSCDDVLKPVKIKLPCDEAISITAGSGFCMVLCKSR